MKYDLHLEAPADEPTPSWQKPSPIARRPKPRSLWDRLLDWALI